MTYWHAVAVAAAIGATLVVLGLLRADWRYTAGVVSCLAVLAALVGLYLCLLARARG